MSQLTLKSQVYSGIQQSEANRRLALSFTIVCFIKLHSHSKLWDQRQQFQWQSEQYWLLPQFPVGSEKHTFYNKTFFAHTIDRQKSFTCVQKLMRPGIWFVALATNTRMKPIAVRTTAASMKARWNYTHIHKHAHTGDIKLIRTMMTVWRTCKN